MRTCPVCDNEFAAAVSPRRVFCSHECRILARNRAESMEKRACPVCDKTFEAPASTRQVYCAPECRREADRRLGEKPPARPVAELPPVRPAPRQQPGVRDPLEPTATRNCPHCDQPVTIVALLATPEAARPSITSRIPDISPLRRTP
ncbi:hypothetical protein [Streptomyces sp. NPDC048527]|uniref:hypothetical protein n=1 Tax=Streptomyces sp. NPDC048527 TaxID=3365568 RepID=UPI003716C001